MRTRFSQPMSESIRSISPIAFGMALLAAAAVGIWLKAVA